MRYRAVISYYGANYVGWQRQLNGLSVQEVLEKALEKTFGAPTSATASGRTDAGVHALGQVVHFDADTSIPADKVPFAVNTHLPDDVSMLSCEIAPENFNARFSAKRKTYCYKIYVSKHRLPVLELDHEHITYPLDLDKIEQAAKIIEGTHDFKCFEASGSVVKTPFAPCIRWTLSLDILTMQPSVPTANFSTVNCRFPSRATVFSTTWCASSPARSSMSASANSRPKTSLEFSKRETEKRQGRRWGRRG